MVLGTDHTKEVTGVSSRSYQRYHHDIVLSDLQPATKYVYSVGFGQNLSQRFSFTTAPTGVLLGREPSLVGLHADPSSLASQVRARRLLRPSSATWGSTARS